MAATIESFRRSYPTHASSMLAPGESINAAVRSNNVPLACGVYVITALSDISTIIYIGKAGTLMRDGSFKEQKLRRRLTNLQGRIRRTVFFRDYIFKRNLAGLMFEWFVTFDGNVRDLPSLAEAKLLQEFFNEHGCLPELNSCA